MTPGLRNQEVLTLIQKADLEIADISAPNGALAPAQAKRFMRIMIERAEILPEAAVLPMKSYQQEISKIRFGSRILRAGTESTPLSAADRVKPDLTGITLDVKKFKAEVPMPTEILEDTIEQGTFRQTIMEEMAKAISRDMDEVIVQGDTASADAFLAKFDGMLKSATSNVYAAGSVPMTKPVLKETVKTLPKEFRSDKSLLRLFAGSNGVEDYRDSLGDRGTVAGDRYTLENPPVFYNGIPVKAVPKFPEDLGAGNNETNIILTDPKNIQVGIWRNIRLETDKDIRADTVTFVATLRFDFKFAEETAVVKTTGVTVS